MFKKINMNLHEQVIIETFKELWIESPSKKVLRIPLERENVESGHVTSIVKYLPKSTFDAHTHPKGEEIFVLEGIFSDEHGDYPAGSYIRNPPGTSHSPFSNEGCTIFVKLDQFKDGDVEHFTLDTNKETWRAGHGGLEVMPLHSFQSEGAALVKWPKGEKFLPHSHFGGEEVYVVSGVFKDEHGVYPKGTWIRSPHLSTHHPWVDEETVIFVKTGHLLKD
jgi:anti-sigma factor ChrR (cupin superfamily)